MRGARRIVSAAAGFLLALALAPAPAGADHRDFAGSVKAITDRRVTVENRMGDRITFRRGKQTEVQGGRSAWEGLRPGDHVIVDWHLGDRTPRARRVRVLPH